MVRATPSSGGVHAPYDTRTTHPTRTRTPGRNTKALPSVEHLICRPIRLDSVKRNTNNTPSCGFSHVSCCGSKTQQPNQGDPQHTMNMAFIKLSSSSPLRTPAPCPGIHASCTYLGWDEAEGSNHSRRRHQQQHGRELTRPHPRYDLAKGGCGVKAACDNHTAAPQHRSMQTQKEPREMKSVACACTKEHTTQQPTHLPQKTPSPGAAETRSTG